MPVPPKEVEQQLIGAAVAGDAVALQTILMGYREALLSYVNRHLPDQLRAICEADDVLQDTWILAYRAIGDFQAGEGSTVEGWLKTIARRRMLDLLKEHTRLKRGGGGDGAGAKLQHLGAGGQDASDVMALLDMLAVYRRTPSQSAAAHELALALERSIDSLPKDLGIAIRLRHVEGLTAKEAASRMSRTEGAFHLLCNRGYKRLRTLMKSGSIYA